MSMSDTTTDDVDRETEIVVGETAAGEPYTLPVEELLTGRLFATGKSGAGKSNTGSVIAEELLERGHPLLIVDVDGEYWGLKEEYEVLHVGATEECDLQVGPEHAGKIAELALEQRVPIILDVSGYVDGDEADALVREVGRELFAREQQALQPFLMVVEEIHEYLPQQGSPGETGEVLTRIAKRGRKRGLGIAGFSQRPADVDKAFITQADCLVWHRLTWDNDTDVVKRVVGAEYANTVSDLGDGEAFVQNDWDDVDVQRVQFRRKRTFDAGATPGLDDVDRPELKSISEDLVSELEEISEQHERRQDRIADLEARLDEKDVRIAELEDELEDARDLQRLGEAFVDAMQGEGGEDVADVDRELLEEKNETIADLRERVDGLEEQLGDVQEERDELATEVDRLRGVEERVEEAERIEDQLNEIEAWFASAPAPLREVGDQADAFFAEYGAGDLDAEDLDVDVDEAIVEDLDEAREEVRELRARLQDAHETIDQLQLENERLQEESSGAGATAGNDLSALIQHDAVQAAVDVAKKNSDRGDGHFDRALAVLASSDGGPLAVDEITPLMDDVSEGTVKKVLRALFDAGVVQREKDGRSYRYALDRDFLERRIEVAEQQVSQ